MKRLCLAAIAFLATGLYGQVPLSITSISPSSAIAGSPTFSLAVTGTDFVYIAGDILQFSKVRWNGVAIPTNYISSTQLQATVDASFVANAGTATVDVVNPNAAVSNSRVFTILAPLRITTTSPLPTATVGSFYSVSFLASGGTPSYGNWRVVDSVLPSGLTLNAATGVLSGTPTAAGTTTFFVYVDDNGGQTASGTFSLTVNASPLTIITTSPLPSGVVGSPYFQTIVATGGSGARTWLVTSGALPPPLTLLANGTITGTPTTPGAYTFTARVTDALGSDTRSFVLTIVQSGTTQGPDGQVGVTYQATLVALSGSPPWTWAITSGQLPPGLTLNSATGVISGIPTTAGTFSFVAQWTDSQRLTFPNTFSISILPAALSITTATPLPVATVGAAYSQTFAATGGTGSYTWSVSTGLPAGLTLSQAGLLSGTPGTAGAYSFTITVTDAAQVTAQTRFTLTVNPASLSITTASPLAGATVGAAYSQTLVATGGVQPYTWSVTAGTLPPGLTFSTGGVLSGIPTQASSYTFTVTVNAAVSKQFTVVVSVPPAPTLSVTGLADTVTPAQQPTFDVQLSAAYSLPISGTVTLAFTPDAVNPADDPAIQFSAGGRTFTFAIAAGQTHAFPTSPPSLQTGTVAGHIDLTVRFSAGGQDITPSPAPSRSIQLARSAPKINSVQVVRTSNGFDVQVTGYSTPRQVTQAMFVFTAAAGKNLQTTQVPMSVDSAFTTWYSGTSSGQYGSTFLYTQPFLVQGDMSAIASVSVTLTNAVGTSPPVSATF